MVWFATPFTILIDIPEIMPVDRKFAPSSNRSYKLPKSIDAGDSTCMSVKLEACHVSSDSTRGYKMEWT